MTTDGPLFASVDGVLRDARGADAKNIAMTFQWNGMHVQNARRLAACWNYFVGMSTDEIEALIAGQGKS